MIKKIYSPEFKAKVLAEVAKKEISIPQVAKKFGISNNSSVYTWLGRTARASSPKPKSRSARAYSVELRNAVLADVEAGKLTVLEIAAKHKIHMSSVYTWKREAKEQDTNTATPITGNGKDIGYLRDVSTYLKHARADVDGRLKRSEIRHYDQAHLLMLLALSELEKHGF